MVSRPPATQSPSPSSFPAGGAGGPRLVLVLGDQLDPASPLLAELDPARDRVVMAEVEAEVRRYPNHKQRVALFLAAMRHFAGRLAARGIPLDYQRLDDEDAAPGLPEVLRRAVTRHRPQRVALLRPGSYDLLRQIREEADRLGVPLEIREDPHFLATPEEFAEWAGGRKNLVMEHFYRRMRRRYGVLLDGDRPAGGRWNFDEENREAFSRAPEVAEPLAFSPDPVTREVLALVERRLGDLPGSLASFDWPVTPEDAERAARDFFEHRLAEFGRYQDAMWHGRAYLFHSRLSPSLNLKLLDPRRLIAEAERGYREGRAPLAAVEGFVRQILGWREYVRGVYWWRMPQYAEANALEAREPLPPLFWSGETEMVCLREVVGQLLERGYAHHIQRLMVTGLFAQLVGVEPRAVQDWFMALYVDSVEWVTLPNVVGMSQHADGGLLASKPYVATGRYVERQSDYCRRCRFDPAQSIGDGACPFTTLYWDFLSRHREHLSGNRRMLFQLRNLQRKSAAERRRISEAAERTRERLRAAAL